jgi:hypothetical protein
VNQHSPAEAKIALFRSLFRGREDVYPRRFESRKTGRAGYSPACANEWVLGVCEKPRIKCSECPHQRFLSVTDEVIRWHLSGRDGQGRGFVIGVYPMLLDETCFFLAAASSVKTEAAFATAPAPVTSPPEGISVLNLAHFPKHLVNLLARHFRQTVFPCKLTVKGVPLALCPT